MANFICRHDFVYKLYKIFSLEHQLQAIICVKLPVYFSWEHRPEFVLIQSCVECKWLKFENGDQPRAEFAAEGGTFKFD